MRIECLNQENKAALKETLQKRSTNHFEEYEKTVRDILEEVKQRKDAALFEYTQKFDHVMLSADTVKVTEAEMEEALKEVPQEFIGVLERAAENIRVFHEKQKRLSWFDTQENGTLLGQKFTPLQTVGVYVPGGKAAYPSSVLMNIIPAKVAGVERIVMVTPPGKDGRVNPGTLAAAKVAGVDEVAIKLL